MKKYSYYFLFFLVVMPYALMGRSPFRPYDASLPRIEARYEGDSQIFILQSSHLEEQTVFGCFNQKFFMEHLLPHQPITYRYDKTKTVNGAVLEKLVNELVLEVQAHKKTFKHFTVLRQRDFNRKKSFGLLIAKFNDYPFVVKLFMETPQSFTEPHAKGLVPLFAFYMSNGGNRHLVGFTRIANLELIKEKILLDPFWSQLVDWPRKWFVLPTANQWMEITGYNIGTKPVLRTNIPGCYAIIADEIKPTNKTSFFNSSDNEMCMELCNYLHLSIDPHIDNFMWEGDKLVIVDTEHFPSFVGFKEEHTFKGYLSWLGFLAVKFVKDTFFRDKQERKRSQLIPSKCAIVYT